MKEKTVGTYFGTLCEECVVRGRYSKSNLKIDLREIKREFSERKYIPASEYKELSEKQSEIIERLASRNLKCNCR